MKLGDKNIAGADAPEVPLSQDQKLNHYMTTKELTNQNLWRIVDTATLNEAKHGYANRSKLRDDTIVSGDCPTWFQLPHVGVKKLDVTAQRALEEWYALPQDAPAGVPQPFQAPPSRAPSVAGSGRRGPPSAAASRASTRASRKSAASSVRPARLPESRSVPHFR